MCRNPQSRQSINREFRFLYRGNSRPRVASRERYIGALHCRMIDDRRIKGKRLSRLVLPEAPNAEVEHGIEP
jgi:hypothetical protein